MEIIKATKATLAASLQTANSNGYAPIVDGLGVMAGKYKFTTSPSEEIFAIKLVEAKSTGLKYALTMVAGNLVGAEESNASVNVPFGTGATDKQFVVSATACLQLKPNQAYDVIVDERARVKSITPFVQVGKTDAELKAEIKDEKLATLKAEQELLENA